MDKLFSPRIVILSVFVFIFQLSPFHTANGQDSTSTATLLGWEQRIRNFMLDRSHNHGGTHFNRGLFREHLNEMSPEHNLDLITYRYTLFQDYDFEQAQNAYRMSTGSLNATDFAVENTIKSDLTINSKNQISINGYHAENIRANRFLFHLGYTRNLTGKHYLGVSHTLSQVKADLDATFFYRYGNFDDGMVEVSASILDWGSNIVQDLAKDSRNKWNKRYEVTHQYSNSPELFSVKYTSSQSNRFKVELMGGLQTYSRKRVEVHADTSNYIDEEWAHYLGGLVEYDHPLFTVGLTYQRTFSKLKRKPTLNSNYDLNFSNWQITNQLGLYATGRIKSFVLEQWLGYGHDIDRLQGEKVPGDLRRHRFERVPFDYLENPISVKSRVFYDPAKAGLRTGLEFHAECSRPQGEKASNGVRSFDFRRTYSIVRDYNARFTYSIGYRFSPHFYLLAGISYDIDKDQQSGRGTPKAIGDTTWFDGGFGRLSISW
ncbi:hypothetical protein [Fodinibius sp. AD559]|uniref:hypothetical protein n=1 Tax=Fodinibius sp. AD559 TaxID=3424179 RepID=UPI0040468F67